MLFWLLLLRLLLLIQPGYVHPDEFFQSPEIAAIDTLECSHCVRTWEWTKANVNSTSTLSIQWRDGPLRSISGPMVVSGIPFSLLRWLAGSGAAVKPWLRLVAPRFVMFLLSSVLDLVVFSHSVHPRTRFLLAASWPMLVLMIRSFSNSLEAVLLSAVLGIALSSHRKILSSSSLGVLIAIGVFNRVTFLFFLPPIALFHLYKHRRRWISQSLLVIFFAVLTSSVLVLIDSLYFGTACFTIGGHCVDAWTALRQSFARLPKLRGSLTITPLSFLAYNIDPKNLGLHGLHPRFTHALINLPVLLGPVAIAWILAVVRGLWAAIRRRDWRSVILCEPEHPPAILIKQNRRTLHQPKSPKSVEPFVLCTATALCGLCFLSLAPHQESRFLLPLLLPVIIAGGSHVLASRKWVTAWFLHSILCLVFFGGLHQGGVVPMLAHLDTIDLPSDASVAFFGCYMAPHHLVRSDLVYDTSTVESALDSKGERHYVVAPLSMRALLASECESRDHHLQRIPTPRWFHVGFDSPGAVELPFLSIDMIEKAFDRDGWAGVWRAGVAEVTHKINKARLGLWEVK